MSESASQEPAAPPYPGWFADFLADRAVRKPSPHTAKAYRQDFEAIAVLVAGTADAVADLPTTQLTKDKLRSAFAVYADTHSSASIRAAGRRGTPCAPSFSPRSSSTPIPCH